MFDCSNLEKNSFYYQETTLNFVVREKEKLFKTYENFGYFKVLIVTIGRTLFDDNFKIIHWVLNWCVGQL